MSMCVRVCLCVCTYIHTCHQQLVICRVNCNLHELATCIHWGTIMQESRYLSATAHVRLASCGDSLRMAVAVQGV